jgi:ribosomal protein S18 acetylase RimI-like enzyme
MYDILLSPYTFVTMTDDLIITVAEKKDVPSLVKLVNSAYRGESSKKGWTTEADLLGGIRTDEDSMMKMVSRGDSVVLKCLGKSELIGCVYLQKQDEKIYLGMLTVSPEIQAKGVGKTLLKAAEEYAQTQECTAITMTVISVREELINWYERHGYKPTGVRKPFPNDPRFGIQKQPLEFVVLEKPIALKW